MPTTVLVMSYIGNGNRQARTTVPPKKACIVIIRKVAADGDHLECFLTEKYFCSKDASKNLKVNLNGKWALFQFSRPANFSKNRQILEIGKTGTRGFLGTQITNYEHIWLTSYGEGNLAVEMLCTTCGHILLRYTQ